MVEPKPIQIDLWFRSGTECATRVNIGTIQRDTSALQHSLRSKHSYSKFCTKHKEELQKAIQPLTTPLAFNQIMTELVHQHHFPAQMPYPWIFSYICKHFQSHSQPICAFLIPSCLYVIDYSRLLFFFFLNRPILFNIITHNYKS